MTDRYYSETDVAKAIEQTLETYAVQFITEKSVHQVSSKQLAETVMNNLYVIHQCGPQPTVREMWAFQYPNGYEGDIHEENPIKARQDHYQANVVPVTVLILPREGE